jgi:predicted RNase H-like HicB family nuclease
LDQATTNSRATPSLLGREVSMTHYIAIFVESDVGEWRVLFPDLPGCEAHGFSLDDAGYAAVSALWQCLAANGSTLPIPMDMTAIERNADWLSRNHIDLSRAVVSMVPSAG